MTTHLMDGDLMRLVDGEAAGPERNHAERHLAGCEPCAARLAGLARASDRFRDAVLAADVTVRPRRRTAGRLAWAAGLLLVLAVGAGVEPLRAWIVERSQALWNVVTRDGDTEAAVDPETAGASTVRFLPAAGVFTLEVAALQAGGTLELVVDDVTTASAAAAGADANLVILPGGLRIANAAAGTGRYVVRLPSRGLTALVLRIGDRAPQRLAPTGGPWTYDLATGARRSLE